MSFYAYAVERRFVSSRHKEHSRVTQCSLNSGKIVRDRHRPTRLIVSNSRLTHPCKTGKINLF